MERENDRTYPTLRVSTKKPSWGRRPAANTTRRMDLVPEQSCSLPAVEASGPPQPSPAPQPLPQKLQPTKLPPEPPERPHLTHSVGGEEGGSPPTQTSARPTQAPSSHLTGPAQPGAPAPKGASVSAEAPLTPTVGPHAATSSRSAFNAFAPCEGEVEDALILKALSPEANLLITQKLDDLREASNGILAGVTNFYNQADLIPADSQGTPEALADPSPLNAAFRLSLIALDTGFPCPDSEVKTPPVFEGYTWTRAACAVLAAVGRGMIRTSPERLKVATTCPLNLKGAFFQLPEDVIPPKTEGELLQCLAEQIAGLVNFRNDLHIDANPYTYFDAIKEKARKLLEEEANLQAKAEAEAWHHQLLGKLKSAGLEEILTSLHVELKGNTWLTDRQQALAAELALHVGSLNQALLEEAKNAIRTDAAAEIRATAEKERTLLQKEEKERVQREISRDVNQEVRNWRITYKEKREKEFQDALDTQVKANNKEALIRAAKELGLHFSETQGKSIAAQKPAQAGTKRNASGNTAPPPPLNGLAQTLALPMDTQEDGPPASNTRSRARTPSGPRAFPPPSPPTAPLAGPAAAPTQRNTAVRLPMRAPSSLPTRPLPRLPSPFISGVATSMHNPNNQMEIDSGERPPIPSTEHSPSAIAGRPNVDPLAAIQASLAALTARIEQIAGKVEGNPRPAQPAGAGQAAPRPVVSAPPVNRSTRPKVSIPRQTNPDDGFIQEHHGTWNVVTAHAIAQQTEANTFASKAAAAQGRTPTGRPSARAAATANRSSNTEVTVLRDGCHLSQEAELAVRAQRPEAIVREVQKQINAQVKNKPLQLLAGRWSSSVRRTGNFVFTIRGKVDFPLIFSYSRFLLAPFPSAELAPTGEWTWAQLRGVPIWSDDSLPRSQDELLTALRVNPAFENAILTITPRWQVPVERLEGESGTVVIAFCDPDGTIARQAREDHVFMFNSYVQFSISRSRPTLIQCTRCHQLGHARNSRACRVPTEALVCFICGGAHRSERHMQECPRVHTDIGICDCPLKCILCGNPGHHARDPKCPQRAAFAPPRNNNQPSRARNPPQVDPDQEGWTQTRSKRHSRVRARPIYRGANNGKQREASPAPSYGTSRGPNDASSEAQVELELRSPIGEGHLGGWENVESLSGNGHRTQAVPRNATPGPSNV